MSSTATKTTDGPKAKASMFHYTESDGYSTHNGLTEFYDVVYTNKRDGNLWGRIFSKTFAAESNAVDFMTKKCG
jgi:hypothetical protein